MKSTTIKSGSFENASNLSQFTTPLNYASTTHLGVNATLNRYLGFPGKWIIFNHISVKTNDVKPNSFTQKKLSVSSRRI